MANEFLKQVCCTCRFFDVPAGCGLCRPDYSDLLSTASIKGIIVHFRIVFVDTNDSRSSRNLRHQFLVISSVYKTERDCVYHKIVEIVANAGRLIRHNFYLNPCHFSF